MHQVAIIDDSHSSRKLLKNLLDRLCPDVTVVGEAGGVAEGVLMLRDKRPDAVFLDIMMEDGMGFDLLKYFPTASFRVIFTTGYNNYATEAFRFNAVDYLLKPINPEELVSAVEKLNFKEPGWDKDFIKYLERGQKPLRLPTNKGWAFWKPEDITNLRADDNMTYFFNNKGEKILVAKSIRANYDLLPDHLFFRCHKSYVVNKSYIKEVVKESGGGGFVILEDSAEIPIARRRMGNFLEWLKGDEEK
ncbi:MAG: LytTR family DNA-binding domain-containing protein [Chitinophagales bacterium]|nr:LytTR family DNA-binding domain-containing protein [Chitinophagales bacterium]